MSPQNTIPDPAPVIELIESFRRSKTMFTAVTLGIFDGLTGGDRSADELAQKLQVNPGALLRLMESCVALGLLTCSGGRFGNTAIAAAYLTGSSERTLTGYIEYSDRALYALWGDLAGAVREGTPRWQQTFGWDAPIFEHFFSTPEKMRSFILGMHGFGLTTSPAVARAFDLSRFHTLADLGGATGHLAIAACEAWPELNGIVVDLPAVVPMANEQIARSPARDRLSAVSGDFFADELPSADLYALGRILHDWSEPKIELLLGRILEHLPAGGALLIAEKLITEDRSGPVSAFMQSLSMLVCTEGKERSLSEYRALLQKAGFGRVEGHATGKYLDAILAVKD